MIIVSSFLRNRNNKTGVFSILPREEAVCPLCRGALSYRNSKPRDVKNLAGEVFHYLLRRLLCDKCGKLHTELPDTIQPYKHYSSAAIQYALDEKGALSVCAADDSTIRRWKSSFRESETDIGQRLASVIAAETGARVPIAAGDKILPAIKNDTSRWLAFVMRLLINSGHKIRTRFAFCPPALYDKVGSETEKTTKWKQGGGKIDKTIKDSG